MKENITLFFKRNYIIVLFIILTLIVYIRYGSVDRFVTVSSNYDSTIELTDGDTFSQQWLMDARNIDGVKLFYDADNCVIDENTQIEMRIYACEAGDEEVVSGVYGIPSDNGELYFPFDKQKVNIGKQYTFEWTIQTDNPSGVKLWINNDYFGLEKNDMPQSASLRMEIATRNMGKIAWLYSVIVILYSFSLVYAWLFKRTFAETVGFAIATIGLSLYVFGICNHLALGVYFVIGLAIAATVCVTVSHLLGKFSITNAVRNPGVVFYLVLIIGLLAYNQSAWSFRVEYDEFSFWGKAVRAFYYHDGLALTKGSGIIQFCRYVPFMPLMQYFFMRIQGYFSEGLLYWGYQITSLSLLMPLFSLIKSNRLVARIMAGCAIIFAPVILFNTFYYSIYIDAFLGIVAGYTLLAYFDYKNEKGIFAWVRMGLGATMLVLTKEMGCVLLVCIAIIIFTDIICDFKKNGKNISIINIAVSQSIWKLAIICVIGMIAFGSYQIYVACNYSEAADFEQRITYETEERTETATTEYNSKYSKLNIVQNLTSIIVGKGRGYQYNSLKRFVEVVSKEPYFGIIPYGDIFLIFIIAAILWKRRYKESPLVHVAISGLLGAIVYLGVLELFYLTAFPAAQGAGMSSYGRYFGTYSTMVILILSNISLQDIINHGDRNKRNSSILIAFLILICLTPFPSFYNKWCLTENHLIASNHDNYEYTSNAIKTIATSTDRIQYVNMDTIGENKCRLVFQDAIIPLASRVGYSSIKSKEFSTDEVGDYVSLEEWQDYLRGKVEYIYIEETTQDFINSYKSMFENEEVLDYSVYKIEYSDDGDIHLIPIAHAIH